MRFDADYCDSVRADPIYGICRIKVTVGCKIAAPLVSVVLEDSLIDALVYRFRKCHHGSRIRSNYEIFAADRAVGSRVVTVNTSMGAGICRPIWCWSILLSLPVSSSHYDNEA